MSKNALALLEDINFEVLKEYFATGDTSALNEERKRQIAICRDCWALMRKYPQRGVLVHQLVAMHGLHPKTATRFVDFTRNTWGDYMDVTQSFLQTFFLDQLMKELSNPNAKPSDKAKNLATLQKHLQNMPQSDIDPTLMESNTININFNIGKDNIQIAQQDLRKLPKDMQELILASIHNDISDVEAIEILES